LRARPVALLHHRAQKERRRKTVWHNRRPQCRALYNRPPITWCIDKASHLHDFPDYAVEDKVVSNCYAIVWMFNIDTQACTLRPAFAASRACPNTCACESRSECERQYWSVASITTSIPMALQQTINRFLNEARVALRTKLFQFRQLLPCGTFASTFLFFQFLVKLPVCNLCATSPETFWCKFVITLIQRVAGCSLSI